MGAGRAGAKATPRFYRDAGHDEIPARGPLAALTVPGAVAAGCSRAEAAKAHRGKHAARRAARRRHQARARGLHGDAQPGAAHGREILPRLETAPASRKPFWSTASRPRPARGSSRAEFADTLEHLAQAGFDDFYRGDVGREIAADLERIGSPVTRADLEKFEASDRRAAQRPRSRPARSTIRRRRRKDWPR